MARGGARINSGPPPDPNALRRDRADDKAGWTSLPSEGRAGVVPAWPLPADVRISSAIEVVERKAEVLSAQIDGEIAPRGSPAKLAKLDQQIAELRARLDAAADAESELWAELWVTPQAVAWERLRWSREVALYCRWQAQAEMGDLDAAKEARQWSDRLGLNPAALLRLRWKIAGGEPVPVKPRKRSRSSARSRLKVVTDGEKGA